MTAQQQAAALIEAAKHILIVQPDTADGDSCGSALGLEEILGDMGKTVSLYCYNEMPVYLRNLEGWDRVAQKPPAAFDLAIGLDLPSEDHLKVSLSHYASALGSKPWLIIDHHQERSPIAFAGLELVDASAAATGQMITIMASSNNWAINERAAAKLATAILSDSLNLTTANTTATTVDSLATLVRAGANLHQLYVSKRLLSALTPELLGLKARLLSQVEYQADNRLAICYIDAPTTNTYKDQHNPTDLIIWEMQWVKGVEVAAVIKDYGSKMKIALKAQRPIAGQMAALMGGGGHDYAAGCRLDGLSLDEAKSQIIASFNKVDHGN